MREELRQRVPTAAMDPHHASEEDSHAGLSEKERTYLSTLSDDMGSEFRGAIPHLNSDVDERSAATGHVSILRENAVLQPHHLPSTLFTYTLATPIDPEQNPQEAKYYLKKLELLNEIPDRHEQEVDLSVRLSAKPDGTDSRSWIATLGSGDARTGVYGESGPDTLVPTYWVVTRVTHPKLSQQFKEMLSKGRHTAKSILERQEYNVARSLAQRNAARVHYKTMELMGIKGAGSVEDHYSHLEDERMDLPRSATPQVQNTTGVLRPAVFQKEHNVLFLNDVTHVKDAKSGVVIMGSPSKNIYLIRLPAEQSVSNDAANTVPASLGRSSSHPVDRLESREKQALDDISQKHLTWEGKLSASAPAALSHGSKRLTKERSSLLTDTLRLPEDRIVLSPIAVKIASPLQ